MNTGFTTGQLVQFACIWEACARKVGNVHPQERFADSSHTDFLLSSAAIAPHFEPSHPVGVMVESAAAATRAAVEQNTNLGIILLLAPLAAVDRSILVGYSPNSGLTAVLNGLTTDDAARVYRAIRLAQPGGLGDAAEQDVRDEPTVTLLEAMRLAADRDLIARQYANGFAEVLDFGVPTFYAGMNWLDSVEGAIIFLQLELLAHYPDSLIARKNGPAVAEDVRRRAAEVLRLGGLATPEGRAAGVALDRHLRSDGNRLNPGTTADLIAACLFVALRENKVAPSAPFRWNVPDWL